MEVFFLNYKNIFYIKNNNFRLAATKYSISNSANKGGEIGWTRETLLSQKLAIELKKLNKGQISKPIKYKNLLNKDWIKLLQRSFR